MHRPKPGRKRLQIKVEKKEGAFSSPSTYRDVQQELIAGIHRTFMWPVVVTVDGNISKPNKRDFKDGDKCYIILILGGNINGLTVEFNGLFEGRDKFT